MHYTGVTADQKHDLALTGGINTELKKCLNNAIANLWCDLLLDSGEVRSVVGKRYLEKYCPEWRDFILPIKAGKFNSASDMTVHQILVESLCEKGWINNKSFLGFFSCQLQAVDQVLFEVVVMENMSALYFILGNEYIAIEYLILASPLLWLQSRVMLVITSKVKLNLRLGFPNNFQKHRGVS
ncbi:uncharacterized protein VP01_1950g3 [Puccinia sorghi]|uniref:Uncharacterized protein n=1 Tax=Puccinia sorghi TaxID=27349 RepID=A0A0L6VCQ7_9BASI|nr:uncharacterized protein VP01_1950g3 [Puccinia sorghi]